jgi:hypothetical protein
MSDRGDSARSDSLDVFLSGAYRRILRVTLFLAVLATFAATVFLTWRSGLGVVLGSALSCLNFVWLHRGTEMMVKRFVEPSTSAPSKLRTMLAFVGRYAFVLAGAYVILKGYPRMLEGFIVGIAIPILAAMAEGVYEAVVTSRNDQTSD